MTDRELVEKKLAFIETRVAELRTRVDPAAIASDPVVQGFASYSLQTAIQAALDVASHVVSTERLGEPETNRHLFELLARGGWVPASALPRLGAMAGMRNVLVHGYLDVDPAELSRAIMTDLADLDAFVAAIRSRIGEAA